VGVSPGDGNFAGFVRGEPCGFAGGHAHGGEGVACGGDLDGGERGARTGDENEDMGHAAL